MTEFVGSGTELRDAEEAAARLWRELRRRLLDARKRQIDEALYGFSATKDGERVDPARIEPAE